MIKRRSYNQERWAYGIFLLFLFGAGLSGCGPLTSQAASKPVACTSQESNANIYRLASVSVSVTLTPTGATGVTNVLSPEQALALLQGTLPQGLPTTVSSDSNSILGTLVNETKSWSDVQTIKLDDSSKVQIVITFLSPPLIRAVYNSEISSRASAIPSLQSALEHVAMREELLFFVSVITNTNNNASITSYDIEIPIRDMVIMNADDLAVAPLHDDHNLAQPIRSSFEPVFGYLSYPIAIKIGDKCNWILNPDYNKKIVITIPHIYVDKADKGTYTWVIPYSPLFTVGTYSNSQTNIAIDPILVSTSLTPPSPIRDLLTTDGVEENRFWQIYAGFLWRQVMQGIY